MENKEVKKILEFNVKKLRDKTLLLVADEIAFLIDKYQLTWAEAFIIFASFCSTSMNMHEDKLKSIKLEGV